MDERDTQNEKHRQNGKAEKTGTPAGPVQSGKPAEAGNTGAGIAGAGFTDTETANAQASVKSAGTGNGKRAKDPSADAQVPTRGDGFPAWATGAAVMHFPWTVLPPRRYRDT